MSKIRRKIIINQNIIKDDHLIDLHLDTPNMYDNVSKFPITLGSVGVYNTQYNCLQKNSGGNSSNSAGKLSLVNHQIRNLTASMFTSSSTLIFKVQFIVPNKEAYGDFVPIGFPGTTSYVFNLGTLKSKVFPYLPPYSFERIITVIHTAQNGNYINQTVLDINNNVLCSFNYSSIVNNAPQNFINACHSYDYIVLMPAWFSPQSSGTFYMKRFEVFINK